ncbi:hypothetical protein LP420_37255 [Massilia sp. B-10]|nr:hypothetical protein LP420_37255 [Massilia sp. B-10]
MVPSKHVFRFPPCVVSSLPASRFSRCAFSSFPCLSCHASPVPGGDPGVRPLGAPGRTSFSRATPVPAWIEKSPALPPAVPGSALSAPVRYPVLHRYQQRAVCAPRVVAA